jgi:hypothetical protein
MGDINKKIYRYMDNKKIKKEKKKEKNQKYKRKKKIL